MRNTLSCRIEMMRAMSDFQKTKLEKLFLFFAASKNSKNDASLDTDDFNELKKKILQYTGWNKEFRTVQVSWWTLDTLFESLLEMSSNLYRGNECEYKNQGKVKLADWYRIWSAILAKMKGTCNLPIWVSGISQLLFSVINKSCSGSISVNELYQFHVEFLKKTSLQTEEYKIKCRQAYDRITDNDRHQFDERTFAQLFANFVVGREEFGPGKYIFDCYSESLETRVHIIGLHSDSE
ncbi:uncharacterized protein LOC141914737 [Tubulanus polymorphus]|uniref:uncharacterized protein LOC141914737 n=1 Tax=Tubulanus polymorphus TaxID=672921 RepID=UPI003DA1D626